MFSKFPFKWSIVLSAVGVSAAVLLYQFYKQKDETLNWEDERKSRKNCKVEVLVPRESLPAVIGRGGSQINDIQSMTGTKIYFEDGKKSSKVNKCVIRGTEEGTQLAKYLVEDAMRNQDVVETYEMMVPHQAVGRIIGKGGSNIRSIIRASSAKVTVDKIGDSADESALHKVKIIGTDKQIELAKRLIEECVTVELELRRKIQESIERRSPRRTTSNTSTDSQNEDNDRKLTSEREGFMQVYISAVANPGRFWMQMVDRRIVDLDNLIEEMTEFYSKEENCKLHIITEPYVDQMVAARFGNDGKWYRAKITHLNQNAENVQLQVYYVDFGDSVELLKEQVFSLRSDFLMVRPQAIECTLANVKPKNNVWSEEAIEAFDTLCHCASWKTVMAKIKSYREREKDEREGSPIPVVELHGKNGSVEVSISRELVRQGYAEEQSDEVNAS